MKKLVIFYMLVFFASSISFAQRNLIKAPELLIRALIKGPVIPHGPRPITPPFFKDIPNVVPNQESSILGEFELGMTKLPGGISYPVPIWSKHQEKILQPVRVEGIRDSQQFQFDIDAPFEMRILPNVIPIDMRHELQMESPKERNTSNWREKLREKVHDKIHKINTIESKGNVYMIYGYILKFNEDGEYCINYAA